MSDKAQPVILAVDDSTDMLALVEKALSDEYKVITASDPGTAIEKACGDPRPDLILAPRQYRCDASRPTRA